MVSGLHKIKGNNAIFIVYANFSMVARLRNGKATRNKETMRAKYIYSIYNILFRVRVRAYIVYVIYYFFYLYIIFIIIVYFVYI